MRSFAVRLAPYLFLLSVSLPLWFGGRFLRGETPFHHNPIDQHSRQARAWLSGRIDLPRQPEESLEIAHYAGRSFNSFPPTPSLVEVPLILLFGTHKSPSGVAVFGFLYLSLAAQFAALKRCGWTTRGAVAASLAFLFGTNVFVSCAVQNVWGYGEGLGYALATIGVCLVIYNARSGPGYALLSLAVGCRPLLLFHAPLMVAVDVRTNQGSWPRTAARAVLWMAPFGLALAAYNYARFDNPLEFGHRYLPWAQALPHGLFSVHYMPWNIAHAFFRLPEWRGDPPLLRFDTLGTAFWLNNGVLVLALWALVRGSALDRLTRAVCAASLLALMAGLLMYEATNNSQFGARYFVDLLPGAFAVFALGYRRFSRTAWIWSLVGLCLNLYGLAAWRVLTTLDTAEAYLRR